MVPQERCVEWNKGLSTGVSRGNQRALYQWAEPFSLTAVTLTAVTLVIMLVIFEIFTQKLSQNLTYHQFLYYLRNGWARKFKLGQYESFWSELSIPHNFFNLVSFKGKILSVKVEVQDFSYCWSSDPYSSKSNLSTDCPGKFKLGPFESSCQRLSYLVSYFNLVGFKGKHWVSKLKNGILAIFDHF